VNCLGKMENAVDDEEEIAPGDDALAIHLEAHSGAGASAYIKFVDAVLGRDALEGLLGIDDGQGNQDRARPGGDLVDVEVEPIREKNNLGRDGRYGVVVVFTQGAEVHLGEGVGFYYAAVSQDPGTAFGETRVVRRNAHEFGGRVALDRQGDVSGTVWIKTPASIRILVAHHFSEGAV